jgi:hypothetical protein
VLSLAQQRLTADIPAARVPARVRPSQNCLVVFIRHKVLDAVHDMAVSTDLQGCRHSLPAAEAPFPGNLACEFCNVGRSCARWAVLRPCSKSDCKDLQRILLAVANEAASGNSIGAGKQKRGWPKVPAQIALARRGRRMGRWRSAPLPAPAEGWIAGTAWPEPGMSTKPRAYRAGRSRTAAGSTI